MSRSRRVRRPARLAALLALALAPLAAGCASLGGESEFVFEYSQKKYTQYIRWSQFDRAEKFVAPESSAAFQQLKASLRDVRFTDYAIRGIEMGEKGDSATVQVTYYAYLRTQPVAVAFDEEQAWAKGEGRAWFVQSTRFAQRELLPGEGAF